MNLKFKLVENYTINHINFIKVIIMNHKKIILVGAISGLVTILTYILGIAGTLIGSVLFSVLYTMLSEALEDPVSKTTFSPDFEWDIVYVIPLIVIAFIQLLLILALLAEIGILPYFFDRFFLTIQGLADNNLYRLLGLALLFISAYPIVLKPNVVKKEHGLILAIVGFIFLARGFVDLGNFITNIYDAIFIHFDLPVAIIAFLLISFVIVRILKLANQSERDFKQSQHTDAGHVYTDQRKINVQRHAPKRVREYSNRPKQHRNINDNPNANQRRFRKHINKSSNQIQFESNDLLDDFKK